MILRVLHWSVWELTITRSRASWPGLCLTLTFKYMKLRRKDRSIICCPIGYPPPLSVSESTPALYQALEYSLEGLRPKTWAEEIYPPSRNLPAEPFQKPGLSCSANLMLQSGENSVLPQPGAGCQSVMYLYIITYHYRRGRERQYPACYFSVMSVVGEGARLRMETELTEPWLTGRKAPDWAGRVTEQLCTAEKSWKGII